MFDATAREILQKKLIARMAVIDSDGYPHIVPVWFMLDGNDIVIISARNTRKVAFIQGNPNGAITVGGENGDGAGYLIKGQFTIEEDPGLEWMARLTRHYEDPEQAEHDIQAWSSLDMIVIRLRPQQVIKVA